MEYGLNDIVEMKKEHPCHKSNEWKIIRMGADIQVLGGQIVYNGPTQLSGAPVKASDLRAGAALVTAGLMADGQTEITNIEFILRGYSNIIEKLSDLGADIRLIED